MKMTATKSIALPFLTINKGAEVEVIDGTSIFDQPMKIVSVQTPVGEMSIHMSEQCVKDHFVPAAANDDNAIDPGLQKLLDTLTGLGKKEEKPRVRVAQPTKFFVLKAFRQVSVSADIGDVLEVLGHKGECPIVKFPSGQQALLDKSFYNLVAPMSTEKACKSLCDLKREHYLKQGFLLSGGLFTKRISETVHQVVKQENLDVVRVVDNGKIVKFIDVDWGDTNGSTLA